MTTLTCPRCGGTRICQTMDALIEYVVAYDGDGGVDADEPAEVVHGAVQYDLIGPANAGTLYCGSGDDCDYEGPLAAFIPAPVRVGGDAYRQP
jgi:hypothetical protein